MSTDVTPTGDASAGDQRAAEGLPPDDGALQTADEPIAVEDGRLRDYTRLRRTLLAVWAMALAVYCWLDGIAADRTTLIVFLGFGMVAATVGRRRVITVFIDWMPFVLVLMLYDWTRNVAVWLDMPTHWHLANDVDTWMFGVNPTVWLQSHLKQDSPPWWEVIVSVVYMSYFIVPYATAAVLWVRDRFAWRRFAACFIAVSFIGLIGYTLVPAAPPWAAARCTAEDVVDNPRDPLCMSVNDQGSVEGNILGEVEPTHEGAQPYVERISDRGWSVLGLDIVLHAVQFGKSKSNLVAAIPSLHAGLTMLLALFMWPRSGRLGKTLFMGYAFAMAFALVYTAEHYVFDILLGWLLAGVVIGVYRFVDARYLIPRRKRKEAESGVPEALAGN